jgi:hypothetical protein
MDPKKVGMIMIDVSKVDESQMPENRQDLKSQKHLIFTGGVGKTRGREMFQVKGRGP